ncbi:hypothetical protein [Marinobacter sp. NFXS9]|uniref:hypothetical protein n=1 Tax=Marinobacter sp. NFXS9 TaxID=2818433 RepID=UPI0032DED1B0
MSINKRQIIENVHSVGVTLLKHGERDAAIDSAIKLEGMVDAYEGLDNTLYNAAFEARSELLQRILHNEKQGRAGQQPDRVTTRIAAQALEALFFGLCQCLDQLKEVRTDLPDDYVARCKASFTDGLLNEFERLGYHSAAFDRLITLRDAWDSGRLESPHVTETTQ